jgi:Tol biopolymer transport system component
VLHYRLLAQIGQGGMGVVWKAFDTRLDREVAIKFLPPELANDADRLARFEREAKTIAALNHPGIVTIHAVEQPPGSVSPQDETTPFIVMELVRGRTLSDLIPRGGMRLERFFELGVSLADAVAAAHAQGITHRDLKPANVMVTDDGRLKVLDFGLAKPVQGSVSGESITAPAEAALTRAGVVLGTAHYMSPEQVEGKGLDQRSDIFSLGIVLYELAAGQRPFLGESAPGILAAILRDEPASLTDLRPDLPPQLGRIIRHCLEKEPRSRTQSAADLRDQLTDLRDELRLAARTGSFAETPRARRPNSGVIGVATLGLVAILALIAWAATREREKRTGSAGGGARAFAARRLEQLTFGTQLEQWPAWSPDGKRIAYCAETEGFSKLFVKHLETGDDEQLTRGHGDDIQPAWSPDGATLAFVRASEPHGKLSPGDLLSGEYTYGDVWLLDLATGDERKVIERGSSPAFSPDGSHIAFDATYARGRRIWVADARGRNPKQITSDVSEAVVHAFPAWSPDGSHIAFQSEEKTKYDIQVADVASGTATRVTNDGFLDHDPVWSPDGSKIYFSSYRGGGLNIWRLAVSPSGTPLGVPEQLTTGAGQDIQPAIDRGGARLIFSVLQQNADLWWLPVDPASGEPTGEPEALVVSTREDSRGAWSPDGQAIAFNSDRDRDMNIWIHSLRDGSTRQLTRGAGGDYQPQWSPDARSIAFFSARSGNADIWIADVASGELRQLTDDPALDINPFFSPDGTRVAFQSDRDGRMELWVVGADGTGLERASSIGVSGHFSCWTPDSKSVIVRSGPAGQTSTYRLPLDGGEAVRLPEVVGGAHMSFSPDRRLILDASSHKSLWVSPLDGSPARQVFEFDDPDIRIDYPVWSPDGAWVLFDRVSPQGGDIWLLEGP